MKCKLDMILVCLTLLLVFAGCASPRRIIDKIEMTPGSIVATNHISVDSVVYDAGIDADLGRVVVTNAIQISIGVDRAYTTEEDSAEVLLIDSSTGELADHFVYGELPTMSQVRAGRYDMRARCSGVAVLKALPIATKTTTYVTAYFYMTVR